MDTPTDTPQAWRELLAALTLLSRHPANPASPLYCTHDTLHVCADDTAFTPHEIDQLEQWGFHVHSDGGFYSFQFGSA
ncbi:hypothetical protein ACQP2U_43675 (plasmid) [Nocardia sp. CA-084685]|uniref:hypothetical protein n=1 Tax=Nocardia sp. CA-084685 TaxID=3239970 RepID=UPI003D985556